MLRKANHLSAHKKKPRKRRATRLFFMEVLRKIAKSILLHKKSGHMTRKLM